MLKRIGLIIFICFSVIFLNSCGTPSEKNCKHENLEWVVTLEATCGTLGSKDQICLTCKKVMTTATIGYKEHTVEVVAGSDPTCTVDGYSDYKICGVCKKVLVSPSKIPAVNHQYALDEASSTATKLVYRCSKCNDVYEKVATTACTNGHISGEWSVIKESTCTEFGSAHRECTVCGLELETKSLPLNEHKDEMIPGKEATCTSTGLTEGSKCSVCKTIIIPQVVTPFLDHIYALDEASSTDTKLVYKCGRCGDSYEKEYVGSTCTNGHTSSDWITTKGSTCSVNGSAHRECTVCGLELEIKSLPLAAHTETKVTGIPATCTVTGISDGVKCSVCHIIIVEQTMIPAINHNYALDETSSTDTKLVYKCSNCGDSYEKNIIPSCSNGHTSSDWITTKVSTCSVNGSAHKECTVCGLELEIKSLPLAAHTEVTVTGTPATCTSTGLSNGTKCSVCNATITAQTTIAATGHDYKIINTVQPTETVDGYNEYKCNNCTESYKEVLPATGSYDELLAVSIYLEDNNTNVVNNNGGVTVTGNAVKITLAGEYDIYGALSEGSIVVAVDEASDVILNLRGINLTSTTTHPIYIESGNKIEISAKADTINYIYDKRTATTTDVVGGGIYSLVDMEIQGKGTLFVTSTYNNAISTTKDLEVKNLTLEVNAPNNALKGNDSLTIESGTIKAISSTGDALKTSNSDISTLGNQRGIITILDGKLDLYAACDGIDASYDCIISGGTINVYTESYSSYSGEVTETSSSKMYLRISSRASGLSSISSYSAMFINSDNSTSWANGTYLSANGRKYYEFNVPAGVSYVKFFAYSSTQAQGQSTSYSYASDQLTVPTAYDTYYVNSASGTSMSGSWENYSSPSTGGMGGMGVPGGGMQEGNSNAATYSCKGIKADNSITINGGTINIKSHDDGIHTNSDVLLGNGSYGTASLTINGGNITVYSDDDGLHADNTLTINGGNVVISNSYEGVEGTTINFVGGTVQIKSLDDGINAKTIMNIKGGVIYFDAGGDGLDSNGSIYMTGGVVLALGPSNGGNGVLDFDGSFSFTGGLLLAVGCSGMNQKPTAGSGNTVSATTITAPSVNSYLTVTSNGTVVAVVKVTKSSQNYQVLAYNNSSYPSTRVSTTTTTSQTLTNGLYYVK